MRDAQRTARALPPVVEVPVPCLRASSPTCLDKANQTKLVRDSGRIQLHVPMVVNVGRVLMGSVGSVTGASARIEHPPAKYARDSNRVHREVEEILRLRHPCGQSKHKISPPRRLPAGCQPAGAVCCGRATAVGARRGGVTSGSAGRLAGQDGN